MNEFAKTIVNGLKSYVQNNIKKARSNWNQNDETAVDYVKNRTHWTEEKYVDIIPETTLYSSSGRTRDAAGPSLTMFYVTSEHISEIPNFTVGEEYTVIWNGTEYKCKAKIVSEVACLGNESIADGIKNTGEPFFIMPNTFDFYREESSDDVLCMIGTTESITEVTIKVSGLVTTVHKIDAKYLPEIKNIKNLVDGESIGSIRTIGTNTEIGEYAFAEGYGTNASGNYSHAEGYGTNASGSTSHAEGESTEASGISSHAEGYDTIASGNYSHAEGYGTNASGDYQHVQGKFNIKDAEGKYAHIVGNGQADGAKFTYSNAHTLDWDGNAWFQGDVYISSTSGTNKDEGSKKLATEEFVTQKVAEINIETPTEYESIILKSSTSGSTKKFRLIINDDGALSAEEVIE